MGKRAYGKYFFMAVEVAAGRKIYFVGTHHLNNHKYKEKEIRQCVDYSHSGSAESGNY